MTPNITRHSDRQDLPEIPPQLTVTSTSLERVSTPPQQPLFTNRTDPAPPSDNSSSHSSPKLTACSSMQAAEEKRRRVVKALAMVNLPHASSQRTDKSVGGGIPDELWSRVEAVQHDGRTHVATRAAVEPETQRKPRVPRTKTEQLLEED
jgi:hypothetical protein